MPSARRRLACSALATTGLTVGIVLGAPVAHATETRTVCQTDSLNVRTGPSTSYAVYDVVYRGDTLTGTPTGSWFRIESGSDAGKYASLSYLCATSTTQTRTVTVSSLNVRTGPSTSGTTVVGTLSAGASITGVVYNTSWFKITSGSYAGRYVYLPYTAVSSAPAPAPTTATETRTVTVDGLNVRTAPSTSGGIVGTLSTGAMVVGTRYSTSWFQITSGAYAGRYIASAYTTLGTSATVPAPSPTAPPAPGTSVLPSQAHQVIVASSVSPSSGTIAWYEWTGSAWRTVGTAGATFGYNGVKDGTQRVEGDGTTPLGTYGFITEFGTSSLTGAMPFRQITDCSYWIEDGAAPDYNRWREQCGSAPHLGVHLMDYVTNTRRQYEHAAAIAFNYANPVRPPNPGSGSGVMLHYEPAGMSTTGCVGVTDRAAMLSILSWMDASQTPTIVIKRA